jgi:hypothetical protein
LPGALLDEEEALWYLLYQDPCYELRLHALSPPTAGRFVPGLLLPGETLDREARALAEAPELQATLSALELSSVFLNALGAVVEAPEYRGMLAVAEEPLGENRQALARAIVAEMIRTLLAEPGEELGVTGETRNRLVDAIGAALGPSERGISGWIGRHVVGLAARLGTRYVERRRDLLYRSAYPFPGDILLYQVRGEQIRAFVRNCLRRLEPPVAVLAHSLGGIACVDLFASEPMPEVERLITVGSQAPFLYEMDALWSRRVGEALPESFPAWLNLYDPRDLLSFVAAGPFAGRAVDVRVDNGQPFPASHSAYWDNARVWSAIVEHLKPC